jgi:outer membrane protein OmpA-like peptidoglycan-associated protein
MKAMRTAFLAMLACLIVATASAQVAPNNQGDVGLITIPTAWQPQPGTFTIGSYVWLDQLVAGDLPFTDFDFRDRTYRQVAGEFSLGFGLTRHWSVFLSAGAEQYQNRGGWFGGTINGIQLPAPFESNEARKVRIGTKVTLFSEADPSFGVGLFVAAWAPLNNGTLKINGVPQEEQINSRRTDWEWGVTGTKGWFTGMVSYILSGEHDEDIRVSNRLRVALGFDMPLASLPVHIIGELDRTILDGGDYPAPNYSMMTAGARFWLGQSGLAFTGAFNTNLDLLFKHGNNPTPFGGIVGISYAAWPPPPPEPVVVAPPAPAQPMPVEEKAEPAPAPAPPPPPAPKKTTDEIFFDAGSARLTNIAKAVLDGIALRMKNDLNATAAITGYSDNAGKEDANMAISAKRADAAKEYLVTRHGIDPNRIAIFARGSQDAGYDNSTPEGRGKNRRAVIVVTLVSGG